MVNLLEETWTGVENAAWPAIWQVTSSAAPLVNIDTDSGDATGRGRIVINATAQFAITHLVTPLNSSPLGLRARFRLTSNNGLTHLFMARSSGPYSEDDPHNGYRLKIDHANNLIQQRRYINGSNADLGSPFTFSATLGVDYWLYWEVFENAGATTLRYRVWQDGSGEPVTWAEEISDSHASRPISGSIALGGNENGEFGEVLFDDLLVTDLAGDAIASFASLRLLRRQQHLIVR